ncbi:ataxin-7-like 1 [Crotalus adamanteus]|uniref:Ataxin-7-like 1 n=1 Tax=Crotalus adamanteus TaxID=8729 RepID=A0AAW1BBK7_CROAD
MRRKQRQQQQLLRKRRRRSGGGAAAAAAMAALERPVPSPEAFLGQPWAAWVREAAPPHSIDLEDPGKEGSSCGREVMRLNKEEPYMACDLKSHLCKTRFVAERTVLRLDVTSPNK